MEYFTDLLTPRRHKPRSALSRQEFHPGPPPKYDRLRSGWGWSVLVRTTSHDGGRAVGPAVRFGGLRRCSPRQSEEPLGPRIPPLVGHADGGEPQRGVAELLGTTGDRHHVRPS